MWVEGVPFLFSLFFQLQSSDCFHTSTVSVPGMEIAMAKEWGGGSDCPWFSALTIGANPAEVAVVVEEVEGPVVDLPKKNRQAKQRTGLGSPRPTTIRFLDQSSENTFVRGELSNQPMGIFSLRGVQRISKWLNESASGSGMVSAWISSTKKLRSSLSVHRPATEYLRVCTHSIAFLAFYTLLPLWSPVYVTPCPFPFLPSCPLISYPYAPLCLDVIQPP